VGIFEAVALGITQGITEFLPISSDGHLALVYHALNKPPSLTFEVFLHFATLLAMVVYFRSDIWRLLSSLAPSGRERRADRRTVLLIVVGTAVSGVVALSISPLVEPLASSLPWVGAFFLVTAAVLAGAELLSHRVPPVEDASQLSLWKAAGVGLAQGLAALPAVSRSGTTIAGGMVAGLDRERAARFSFLLGIPIIALAAAKDGLDVATGKATLPPVVPSIAGFIAAGAVGYLAIWALLSLVKRYSLYWFAAYTAALGTAILVWSAVK
jgi:undecaprenyl-diphosphatase